tara:strand:- start:447 stop:587 length:141 start_codon:yes stop_codon:yes gene_type:complete
MSDTFYSNDDIKQQTDDIEEKVLVLEEKLDKVLKLLALDSEKKDNE